MANLRGIVTDFLAKGPVAEEYVYPDMPLQNPDDNSQYAQEPPEEKTEAEPVRIVHNVLDFLQGVVEEVSEWVERETGEGHKPQEGFRKPLVLRVNDLGATDFFSRRYAVGNPGSTPLAFKKSDRKALRIVNWGPDAVYVAHESMIAATAGTVPGGAMLIPASSPTVAGQYWPILLPTQDEVWAIASGANVCTVEVADFYGVDNA